MKKIILTIALLIIGTSADTGLYFELDNYWAFGKRFEGYSLAIDSDYNCVKYDGEEKSCTLTDWSIMIVAKNLMK